MAEITVKKKTASGLPPKNIDVQKIKDDTDSFLRQIDDVLAGPWR